MTTTASRKTLLFSLLVLIAFLAMAFAYLRMSKYREDAQRAGRNLASGKTALADIHRWKSSPGRAAAAGSMDTAQITAKVNQAANSAAIALRSTEPLTPRPFANTDYTETEVSLGFEPLTLKQLITFLVTLSQIEPNARAKSIELTPPEQLGIVTPPGGPQDLWIADVSVAYLTYTPQARQPK